MADEVTSPDSSKSGLTRAVVGILILGLMFNVIGCVTLLLFLLYRRHVVYLGICSVCFLLGLWAWSTACYHRWRRSLHAQPEPEQLETPGDVAARQVSSLSRSLRASNTVNRLEPIAEDEQEVTLGTVVTGIYAEDGAKTGESPSKCDDRKTATGRTAIVFHSISSPCLCESTEGITIQGSERCGHRGSGDHKVQSASSLNQVDGEKANLDVVQMVTGEKVYYIYDRAYTLRDDKRIPRARIAPHR